MPHIDLRNHFKEAANARAFNNVSKSETGRMNLVVPYETHCYTRGQLSVAMEQKLRGEGGGGEGRS